MATVILGTASAENLVGTEENDIIYSNGGDDRIWGFGGNDTLVQNIGQANTLYGGRGNDIYVIFAGTVDAISENRGGGIDTLRTTVTMTSDLASNVENIENISYGFGLVLRGNELNNRIDCGDASDVAFGRGGNDIITGSQTNPCGLSGEGGNDRLFGGERSNGTDTLNGGPGADFLQGRIGPDSLTGGPGNDTFHYRRIADSTPAAMDTIFDFDDGSNDRIDLSALFGPAMVYRHAANFTGPGQVRINNIPGPDLLVEVNTGGSLAPDVQIRLTATTLASMTASDFVL